MLCYYRINSKLHIGRKTMANMDKIRFKTYCWSVGTTSFRMRNFNYNIEQQLIYLKDFFSIEKNQQRAWRDCQKDYYDFLKKKGFVKGDAGNPEKDARQKTSGLKDLGLINTERRLTPVGEELVRIAKECDFKDDNFFAIDKDSYIYLNQLLKYTTEDNVRPFVVLVKVLNDLDYITEDEFKYLLPLATSKERASEIVDNIKKYRTGSINLDDLMISLIESMDNYENALEYFIENEPSEELFMTINMNRKSPSYEKPYYKFFLDFYDVYCNENDQSIIKLFNDVQSLKGSKKYWNKLLFKTTIKSKFRTNPRECINKLYINKNSTMKKVKEFFFLHTHLYKWKQNLDDYYDLNRRYFKVTDIIIFEDSKIQLATTAKYYFKHCIDKFFEASFCKADLFDSLTTVEQVLGNFKPDMEYVYEDIAIEFDEEYIDPSELNDYINQERLENFNKLIDKKFTDSKLIYYLDCFKNRDDDILTTDITEDADIPTMFEYVVGICWYKISNREGNILDYMNLSLDANLLPKQHAGGGEADIVYKYTNTVNYPEHTLLVEATLADSIAQRRMEMEPVSRHLMRQLEISDNDNDYAILVTKYVHPSVVSDFRGRAKTEWTLDFVRYFNGLKIVALGIDVIKSLVVNKTDYSIVYKIIQEAHLSTVTLQEGWYDKEIIQKLIKTS